jgi:hypothetical protein
MDYIETWKEVMQKPSDFYRKMPTTGGYADPLTFAAISYIIYGLLVGLFNRGMMENMYDSMGVDGFGFSTTIMIVILIPIMGIISLFIGAAILYFIYKIFGGTGTYEGTVRFMSYATAVQIISWIPFVGFIVGLYKIYLYIVGGMVVHNVSMGRSAIAVILPYIVSFLLALIIAVIVGAYAFSMIFPS